jgi:diguanylate cyclase (GGDEF)-like protein/PAS domain S-box-containing protein
VRIACVLAGTAAGMFLYELAKTLLLPEMSLWQSHAVTIAFSAVVAAGGARWALRAQARLHGRLVEQAAERERDEARHAALADGAERFRAMVETSPEATLLHRGGRVLYVNAAGARLLGVPDAGALVGRAVVDLVRADHRADAEARLAALDGHAAAHGPPALGVAPGTWTEFALAGAPGTARVVEAASVPVTWDGRRAIQTHVRDITARRAAEDALRDSERHFRSVTASAADAIITADAANRVVFWNAAAERLFGYAADDALGRSLSIVVPPEHRAAHEAGLARVAAGAPSGMAGRTVEVEGVRADGTRFPMELSLSVWDAGGQRHFTSVVRDVTERKRHESALREREARLQLVLGQLPAVLWTTDRALRFTSSVGTGLARIGLAPGEVVGRPLEDFLGAGDPDRTALVAHQGALAGRATAYEHEWTAGVTFASTVEPLRDGDGVVVGTVGLAVDVSERKRLEAQLAHQAFHDALTGLANRALFRDRVTHALARVTSAREGRAEHVAVLYLDLDDFKAVNDTLGHGAGDRLLTAVAERLLRATRGFDTVARLGGDEFAVLLEGMATPADAEAVVARVGQALAAPLLLDGRAVRVRASVGLAHATGAEDAEALVRNADVAMYEAKGAGKGRHAVFAPTMHAALVARTALEADLRAAVDALVAGGAGHGFRLVYQPVVDLGTGRVRAFEALMRWEHPTRGAVAPTAFIAAAEEAGLVGALGRWALGQACGQLAAWLAEWDAGEAAGVCVNVNVSGRQLDDARLVDDVAAALATAGLAPERLTLEVTETAVMADAARALTVLRALRALGVTLAVDDFGTGYSSLAYLQRLPVDVLKIDKAFVDGVARGGPDAALARTVVALGEACGLRTVAEGVETEAQRAALAALGCAAAQGYLFARPLEPAAAGRLLACAPAAARPSR